MTAFEQFPRSSYEHVSRLPTWWLLDEHKKVVASVRAESADTARSLFKAAGLSGAWIRRASA